MNPLARRGVFLTMLALARRHVHRPAPGVSLLDGDLSARVHALVDPRRGWRRWPHVVFQVGLGSTVLAIVLFSEHVHHTLETVLSLLS
ncbi:MAG: hypothetical protein MJD61_02320 [Proteobacteria bacterium]|nr:hypothetical protein [Pseudomonadota bacterium]